MDRDATDREDEKEDQKHEHPPARIHVARLTVYYGQPRLINSSGSKYEIRNKHSLSALLHALKGLKCTNRVAPNS